LEVTSVGFVVSAGLTSLNSLGLNKHRLTILLVTCVVHRQNCILVIFDHLDAGLLQCLADQNLEDWLHLKVVIEKVGVVIHHLNCLIIALLVGDISRRRLKRDVQKGQQHFQQWPSSDTYRSVDKIIWLDTALVDHVVAVIKFLPVVHGLHLHLLLLIHVLHMLLLVHLVVVVALIAHLLLNLLLLVLFNQRDGLGNSSYKIGASYLHLLESVAASICLLSLFLHA